MKNLFLIWLLLYSFTGATAFAEKAMSPVLLTPADFSKSISKDNLQFTWQVAQNETVAKVIAYRIVISEDYRFNGYSQSTGKCNISCVVGVINTPSYLVSLRSSKTYYWHVQGISAIENGEWSRTSAFKTGVTIPSIISASASPNSITQGGKLNYSATLSSALPSSYSVKVSDGSNLYAMNGSGISYSLTQSPTQIGKNNYSIGIYDSSNNLKSSLFNSSYEVKKLNTAPTLNFISGNTSATTGTTYTVQLQANDSDNNLSQITINWGDGSTNSQNASNGSTLTFTHTYATANSYTWSATATDSFNAGSEVLSKNVSVTTSIVIPNISSASASPISTTLGNSINFSASLSSSLPSGYSVKLSYGSSSVYMSGSGTNYSVVQTPTILGQQVFNVGIYDANNNLKGNAFTSNFEIVNANSAPSLSFVSGNTTTTAGTSYSIQLQASDADNNLKSITVIWGDGASDTQTASNATTLTFTHSYSTANTYTLSATATDFANATSIAIAKSVTVSAALVTPSAYTKISNTGATLPDTAVLGSGSNDWACTKDNKTGLTWEVKTDDGGLRDKDWVYSWYKPSGDNGGFAGYTDIDKSLGTPYCSTQNNCNTDAFTNAVNAKGLCGKKDWRMPTKDELEGLLTTTSTINQPINDNLFIDANYFPNTNYWYWSSSPLAGNSSGAWYVNFLNGNSNVGFKGDDSFVRLVHNSQPPPTSSAYTKISNTGATLPDTAVLGSGSNDWACTKDNKTGLIWEVKTDDGGLRDKDWVYSWYKPSGDNGGNAGYTDIDKSLRAPYCSTQNNCNTDAFTNAVNAKGLCGKKDWRMPTKDELEGLLTTTSTINQPINDNLFIDANYFPNTNYWYWSSSPNASFSSYAWHVLFSYGSSYSNYKYNVSFVRLVR